MRTTVVNVLMLRLCFVILCFALSWQLQGRERDVVDWHFVTPMGSFTTNALEGSLSSAVRKLEVGKCVEFRLTDKIGSELIRGRIKKYESYEKLYSVLYAEITNSAMPKRLLLSSMDVDVSGEMGEVCVRGKKWNAALSKFQTTEKPKFVYYTVGTFMVNVCGNENDVMGMAMRIYTCLAAFVNGGSMVGPSSDGLSVQAARHCVCGDEMNLKRRFCSEIRVFGEDGRLTVVGAWLSLALLDNHKTLGKDGKCRSDVALQLLNESRCFSPLLSVETIDGVIDALRRTFGNVCDNSQ